MADKMEHIYQDVRSRFVRHFMLLLFHCWTITFLLLGAMRVLDLHNVSPGFCVRRHVAYRLVNIVSRQIFAYFVFFFQHSIYA